MHKFQFMSFLTVSQPNFKISDKSAYLPVTKLAVARNVMYVYLNGMIAKTKDTKYPLDKTKKNANILN